MAAFRPRPSAQRRGRPPPPPNKPRTPRPRRSLTHVGGPADIGGDAEWGAKLSEALDVPPSIGTGRGEGDGGRPERFERSGGRTPPESPDRAHVHGFHTYPARMHPVTAARLIAMASAPGQTILDPFCGSGTVLVEAMRAGRTAVGTDINPLAIDLAHAKTTPRTEHDLDHLRDAALHVANFAKERRLTRAGATRRFAEIDVTLFEPHVLLELDSLRAGIELQRGEGQRRDLSLVLSSLLVKLSRMKGDTSDATAPRRTAAGYTTKLFVKKTEEWCRRLHEFSRGLRRGAPAAYVMRDDARKLGSIDDAAVDAIVTSPPYVATYDYLAQHALRLRWLGYDAEQFDERELGARRHFSKANAERARAQWADELSACFAAFARVLRPEGSLILLIADSAVGDTALRAEEIVADVAPAHGFTAIARASQPRPHFHGPTARAFDSAPRAEHALLLRRAARSTF